DHPLHHSGGIGEGATTTQMGPALVFLHRLSDQGFDPRPVASVDVLFLDEGDRPSAYLLVGVAHSRASSANRATPRRNGPLPTTEPAQADSSTRLSSGRKTSGTPGKLRASSVWTSDR